MKALSHQYQNLTLVIAAILFGEHFCDQRYFIFGCLMHFIDTPYLENSMNTTNALTIFPAKKRDAYGSR